MKSYRKELWFNAPARMHFTNITSDIRDCLAESGIKEGLVLVNAMHITASVFINDDESGLHHDYKEWLEAMAPHEPVSSYRHNDTGEDNADAHIKRQIMGREVVVAVIEGEATLKRFFKRDDAIILHAENPAYEDIIIAAPQSVYIAGKLVGVIRRCGV